MISKYYQKHKERLRKEAHERYLNLSEEGKDKRRKKARERCNLLRNFLREQKSFCYKNFF